MSIIRNTDRPSIVQLKPNTTVEVLQELLALAEEGRLKDILCVGIDINGQTLTGSSDIDLIKMQSLINAMQIEFTVDLIALGIQKSLYGDDEE